MAKSTKKPFSNLPCLQNKAFRAQFIDEVKALSKKYKMRCQVGTFTLDPQDGEIRVKLTFRQDGPLKLQVGSYIKYRTTYYKVIGITDEMYHLQTASKWGPDIPLAHPKKYVITKKNLNRDLLQVL